MARPSIYAHGRVNVAFSLSTEANVALTQHAAKSGLSRSQAASVLILKALGKPPPKLA